jgi:RimJ/RimL family protein N-acetyltransferase
VSAPHELRDGGTQLRRFTVDDAEAMAAAVRESMAHLARWLPWANDDTASVETQRQRMRDSVAVYDDPDATWDYAVCDAAGTMIGSASILARDDGHREIGYWVHAAYVGRGHATRAARLLTKIWREHRHEPRIEIWCDEANVASAAIPRRLGYRLDRIADASPTTPGETGRMMVWVIDR